MQCTLSGRKEAQLAVARFLAVCAARNDTAYRVDVTDANPCVRELRPESFGKRSVSSGGTLNRYQAASLPYGSG
jgi:hypothetical protein